MAEKKKRITTPKPGCSHYIARDVPIASKERWKKAAAKKGISMRAWIITSLDNVAEAEVGDA